MQNQKKRRLRLLNPNRVGKGISKTQANMKPGLKKFFILLKENFNKIVTVNIIMVLGNFPAFFLIATFAGLTKTTAFAPLSDTYQNFAGMMEAGVGVTPYTMSVFAIEGMQSPNLLSTGWTYLFNSLGALTLITFGPINAGTAYVLRNIVSGEPVFVWHDFKYAFKRNLKQSLPFGIVDGGICVLLCMNIYNMFSSENFLTSMLFWTNIVIFIVYFFMRYYMYVQMVTFKLSVFKMIKNSLSFSLLGIKRNFMALFGILIGLILEFVFLFMFNGVLMPFAIAAPLTLFFSLFAFMKVYAAYYKIKELMIDPYYKEHPEEKPEEPDYEVIMHDDVSEQERLKEIKKRNNIQ